MTIIFTVEPLQSQLEEQLRFLQTLGEEWEETANPFVRTTADFVSGAVDIKDQFISDLDRAGKNLQEVRAALRQNQYAQAKRFLDKAKLDLDQAKNAWNNYLEATGDGAAAIHWFLSGARNTSGAAVVAGGIALATGGGALLAAYAMGATTSATGAVSLGAGLPPAEKLRMPNKYPQPELNFCPNPPKPILPITETGGAVCASTPKARDREAEYWNGKICDDLKKQAEQKLERKILAAIREPTATAKKESPQKLEPKKNTVAWAKEALLDWKNGKESLANLGEFLIVSESDSPEKHLSQWREDVESRKQFSALAPLMDQLYKNYLFDYSREHATLTDFLEGRGGNCEAETKLIVAALKATDISIPSSQKLAVQIFADHLQAVLYDKDKGEVFNLLTGETKKKIEAPLYEPHIFYDATLKGKGETSPVEEKELLIAEATETPIAGITHFYNSNTRLQFPSNPYVFSTAPISERNYLMSPYGNRGELGQESFLVHFSLEDMSPEEASNFSSKLHFEGEFIQSFNQERLMFRTRAQLKYYESLTTAEERFDFLTHLTKEEIISMQEKFNTPLRQGLRFLSDPSVIKKMGVEDLLSFTHFWEALSSYSVPVDQLVNWLCNSKESPAEEKWNSTNRWDASEKRVKEKLAGTLPIFKTLQERAKTFRERVRKHPLEFVLFMNQLNSAQRKTMALAIQIIGRYPDLKVEERADYKIQGALADKHLIGLEKQHQQGHIPTFTVTATVLDGMPIHHNEPGQKGERTVGSGVSSQTARYTISEECMLDLVLEFGVKEQWNSRLAKAFVRLNKDGRYDQKFLAYYSALNVKTSEKLAPELATILIEILARKNKKIASK